MAYRVRSRKFCCCIPVRLGALIIALLGLGVGAAVTIAGVVQTTRGGVNKLAYFIQIGVYALLAILSFFGLIGALLRKRKFVHAHWFMLVLHLLFSLASGGFFLYHFYKDSPTYVSDCENGSTDSGISKACQDGLVVMKVVVTATFIVNWLIELWGCVIVRNYYQQLGEEGSLKKKMDQEARGMKVQY